ncbi:MAG TPA: ATP-binding protein [Candidatus Sulfotelmatobacter sp.]|nr:ATP-binding protein [Candidatus Sulfotelmatobacter sp.]
MKLRSLAARVALSAMLVSALAVGTIAIGVLVVGSATFDHLMEEHGATAAVSHAMFNESITRVVLAASALAIVGTLVLAIVLGRMIERPLDEVARAARRVAEGGYDTRVRRPAAPELASVADSFNQMAASLEDQERQRRDLILNFAHELRTPLTNLHGYLEGLSEGVVEPGPEIFASLQNEVGRLRRLSHSLDALADGVDPEHRPEELDMVALIKALLELNRPRFDGGSIKVNVDLPSRLPARADPDSLSQVIGNLLQNAARYTPPAGTVWVRAEQQRDSVLVSIANTGAGIPASDLDHVFERFYRVEKSRDSARGGAGIGLAIVKQLVEAVGGQVGAESESGITRFWFRLPAPS